MKKRILYLDNTSDFQVLECEIYEGDVPIDNMNISLQDGTRYLGEYDLDMSRCIKKLDPIIMEEDDEEGADDEEDIINSMVQRSVEKYKNEADFYFVQEENCLREIKKCKSP